MNPINRLNLLLSDILHTEPAATLEVGQGSIARKPPPLTFAEQNYRSSTNAPLPPRRNPLSVRQRRQRQHMHRQQQQHEQQQQQQTSQPLLNSSTLDDLFRALTLECEQYLTGSNRAYDQTAISRPSLTASANVDSNDEDYENLQPANRASLCTGHSALRTSIEVSSPAKRQIVSVNVSSKLSPTPLVTSSRTYPLLSTSCTAPVNRSSEDDSLDVSTAGVNRRPVPAHQRRRRTRRQPTITPIALSSTDDDERVEASMDKRLSLSKRSCSTDHRQHRTKSIYDNQPIVLPSQRGGVRRVTRRRDGSLQQTPPNANRHSSAVPLRFSENLCSPLSVLLTSARSTSDFVDRTQPSRQSRVQLADNPPPTTLLDRMHQRFYHPSITRANHHNIPTQRIPSYPVF